MKITTFACVFVVLQFAVAPANGAERYPFWGEWEYWFTDGLGGGHVYGSETAARNALKSTYESSYRCPATVSTVGGLTWGNYVASAYSLAYLKHADQIYELRIANDPDCENNLPPIRITLRQERDLIPPVCPGGFLGPFPVAPDGPWYVCRDDEKNFFENPLQADCPPTAGNPCELTTGAKIERVVDYTGPGIEFVRTFRSNLERQIVETNWPWPGGRYGTLGANWTHNYTSIILYDSAPFLPTHLIRPSGAVIKLFEIEPHVFIAENGSGIQLRPVDPSNYSGDWYVFLPSGAKELHRSHVSNGPYGSRRHYFKELHDPRGMVTTINYSVEGEVDIGSTVEWVVGPFGHVLEFAYVSEPYPSSILALDFVLNPASEKIDFVHHEDDPSRGGNILRGVIYSDLSTIGYRYERKSIASWADNFLREIIDENGAAFATFDYYDEGDRRTDLRVKSTRHGEFERTDFAYAYTGESTTVTDMLGHESSYVFQPTPGADPYAFEPEWVARSPAAVTHPDGSISLQVNEPDGQRRLTKTTDANSVVTLLEYDAYHLISRKEGYDASAGTWLRETRYEYLNETSDLKTLVREASVACEGRYRDVKTGYAPGTQWVTSVTVTGYTPANCDTPINRRTRFSDFNAHGQPRIIDGPRAGARVVVAYYECETGGACGQLKSVTNALGHVTRFESYDAHGRLTRATDPNGVETVLDYTSRGWVARVTRNHATGSRITQFQYEPTGQIDVVTLPDGVTLDFEWNDAHLLESVADARGNRIEYGYDARGDQVAERVIDAEGSLRRSLAMTWDARSQPQSIQQGENPALTIGFDAVGQIVSAIDPSGNINVYAYDALHRLRQVVDPFNGPQAPAEFIYDDHDNLMSVRTPNSAFTAYEYDDFGNRVRESSPDRGTTLYGYAAAGDMTCKADARITGGTEFTDCAAARAAGVAWSYAYDALGRPDTIDFLDTPANPDVDYDYDSGPGHIGQLTSVLNVTGDGMTVLTDLEYDVFGNRTRQTDTVPARGENQTGETRYTWDSNNRLREVIYPNGRIVSYGLVDGRIETISTVSPFDGTRTDIVPHVGYHPFGPPSEISFGNDWVQLRKFDTAYRPSEILLGNTAGNADARGYNLDFTGNPVAVTDYITADDSVQLRYDALHRLVSDSRVGGTPGVDTYTYDANGNRLSRTGNAEYPARSIEILSASNRQLTVNGVDVAYDAAGNIRHNALGVTANYDSAGRLAMLRHAGVKTSHLYDGLGLLSKVVYESNCGCSCQYTHDYFTFAPDGRLLHYESEKGVRVSTDYVWLDGLPVVAIEESFDTSGEHLPGSTRITYLHTDHLGTPVLGTDLDGVVVWKNRPDAFGHAQITTAGPDIRLRFPGQVDYGVGGIHYNTYRDYDSQTGRYLESDPIGLAGGLNTYAYAVQNPLANVDPLGLDVLLQTHPVALGFDHAKLMIIPTNQAGWRDDPRFSNMLPDGRRYLTLGAGPEEGDLVSNLNRRFDIRQDRNESNTDCSLPERFASEDELIRALLAADARYRDNRDYEFFPQSFTDGYNSNSYISGLLEFVGISEIPPPRVPGFDKPLPAEDFR